MALPVIGITVGDPAGIGPEIAGKAALDPRVTAVCTPRLYGLSAAERPVAAFSIPNSTEPSIFD